MDADNFGSMLMLFLIWVIAFGFIVIGAYIGWHGKPPVDVCVDTFPEKVFGAVCGIVGGAVCAGTICLFLIAGGVAIWGSYTAIAAAFGG